MERSRRVWSVLACALILLDFAGSLRADDDAPSGRPAAVRISPQEEPSVSDSDSESLPADTSLIDVPTAAVLDYGGYQSQSRFYSNGGVLEYASFGVYRSLNIGASLSMDGLIGEQTPVRLRAPAAQVKYRLYDGSNVLPALAIGYDGQGYRYNSVADDYNEKERGLYLVGSKELGISGLEIHPSLNVSDFNEDSFFGAIPVSYNIEDKVSLMAEWDNINTFRGSRLNSGVRVYLTSHFHLDFAVRDIGKSGTFSDGQERGSERIVQLWYVGSF